jgi:hypothetical protein
MLHQSPSHSHTNTNILRARLAAFTGRPEILRARLVLTRHKTGVMIIISGRPGMKTGHVGPEFGRR